MTIKGLVARLARSLGVRGPADERDADYEFYRFLADHSIDVVCRFDTEGRVRYLSPSAERMFGAPPEQLLRMGRSAKDNPFLHPDDRQRVAESLQQQLQGEIAEYRMEFRVVRIDGEALWVESNARTIFDPDTGRPSDVVLTIRDITSKKSLESELATLANSDGLTGLANRRAFDAALRREWNRAICSGTPLSLLVLDVDHFKQFNDSYGHKAGDECLRETAAVIRQSARRPRDLAARYGGDEFAVILPDTRNENAVQIGGRICTRVASLNLARPDLGPGAVVTVSVGTASFARIDHISTQPELLIQAADDALYLAKARGRNRVETAGTRSCS